MESSTPQVRLLLERWNLGRTLTTTENLGRCWKNFSSCSLTQFSGSLKAFLKQSWISQNRQDFTVMTANLMLKGDAQYSREEVVEVSSLSRN